MNSSDFRSYTDKDGICRVIPLLSGNPEPGMPPHTDLVVYINPGVSSPRLFIVSIELTPETANSIPFTLSAHPFSTPKAEGRDNWSLYHISGTEFDTSLQTLTLYTRGRQTVDFIVNAPPPEHAQA